MNDATPHPKPPSTSASPPAATTAPGPAVAARPAHGVAWVALALAIASLALGVWAWSDARERSRDLKTDVSRLLNESGKENLEAQVLARNADDKMRAASERLNYLETQFADAQQQQIAIEALYKEMAQARDNWTLAEVEPMLGAAAQQLQLAGNVRAAIVALEAADARLARQGQAQFATLRRALASDLAKLRSVPEIDEIGITARVEALVGRIDALPLAGGQASEAASATRNAPGHLLGELLAELRGIVQIRRTESSEGVLLPPDQAYFLRENLRLRLLGARLAVLARNPSAWRTDLAAAQKLIAEHFDARNAAVKAARQELAKLVGLTIAPTLPDLDASLAALASYKAVH